MIIRSNLRLIFGFVLFCSGYLIINQQLLTETVLYRLVANDYYSSIVALALAAAQAIVLLICIIAPGRIQLFILLFLAIISALTNIIFVQILDEKLSFTKFVWLVSEAHQAESAAKEFATPALIGVVKVLIAFGLFLASRTFIRPGLLKRVPFLKKRSIFISGSVLVLAALPSLLFLIWARSPQMAERNIYSYAIIFAVTPAPPQRPQVNIIPDASRAVQKIVWIIDESVNYPVYLSELDSEAITHGFSSYGSISSLSNCSGPSNLALRSGVPIPKLTNKTDLRKQPSIWRYARKAGYRTGLWDGQVLAAPQNLMFKPELALIDDYVSAAEGIDTDRKLAQKINWRLRQPGRDFIVAILRGVHFQYSDHYPENVLPSGAGKAQQYVAAVRYSKRNFFARLVSGIDDDKVVIVYTSDHGQNLKENNMPHCSVTPDRSEFETPLAIKMPVGITPRYSKIDGAQYSASQIFPTSLLWMGYDEDDISASYDAALPSASLRRVWFGRDVYPVTKGQSIELHDFR